MSFLSTPLMQVSIRLPYAAVTKVVDFLEAESFLGVSWYECTDAAPLDLLDDNGFPIASEFQIDAFTKTPEQLLCLDITLKNLLTKTDPSYNLLSFSVQPVDDTDWLSACYVGMPAQRYGRFYVYGSHIQDPIPDGYIPIKVDAATAFGSGEHPTTAGCLTMLSRLIDHDAPMNAILDMGCGSGILGIAAKKYNPKNRVVLADCDGESVRVADYNAKENQTSLDVFESFGFDNPIIAEYGPFDLIFANILAQPLCDLARDFYKLSKQGGKVILSGFLTRHHDKVTDAYQIEGFNIHDTLVINDWVTLVMVK